MSGRAQNNERGSHPGRGYHRPSRGREVAKAPPGGNSFSGINKKLPTLNLGSGRDEPIEFLRIIGEYCAVNYHHVISDVFRTTPPAYGVEEEEPEYPQLAKPENPTQYEKTVIASYINDMKVWSADQRKIRDDKKVVYALVYGQLSEASRGDLTDEDWVENHAAHDLINLIKRIRATHIAVQSGNARQDQERVRAKWYAMQMGTNESIYVFRKRVDEYQLERESVGLDILPESELVIGVLNRLDHSRFSTLVTAYLANERRGIAELPETAATLWKELRDSQVVRYNSVYTPSQLLSIRLQLFPTSQSIL
jgi:hypothetical protein